MIVSLFHGSTWSNPQAKETVFIAQYFLQPSIIINGLRSIREKVEEYVYLRKTIVGPAVLKVPIYFTEQIGIIFVWKVEIIYRDPILSWWTSIEKLPSFFQKN